MPSLPPRKATLQAVAEKAKVSHSTVSLILNGRGKELRIQNETCTRVFEAARELNYEANYFARGLRGKSTFTIGILWTFSGPHRGDSIIRRVTERAFNEGYIAHFFDPLGEPKIILRLLKELARRCVDGVIVQIDDAALFENPEIQRLLALFRAAVVVSQSGGQPGRDVVEHSRTRAMNDAVGHLIRGGRQRLAMLGGQYRKFDIAREAWLSLGRAEQDITLINVNWYREADPIRAVQENLKAAAWGGEHGFDSLLCSTDETAFISIHYLHSIGLCVPRDVAVIGFNDSEAARCFRPALASVSRNDDRVTDKAIDHLFTRLNHPDLLPQKTVVEMDFVPRYSAHSLP